MGRRWQSHCGRPSRAHLDLAGSLSIVSQHADNACACRNACPHELKTMLGWTAELALPAVDSTACLRWQPALTP